ncbi:hypothetical protein GGC65_004218 [Sphingopyxis sp. OAS728]|uniref:hypothetical protein n=1 Tax=Sphingopyxis sp. OAS728 TaxID=2663823 RepID=UPI0017893F15|nr:hypothetical protein [Sphingopyxis sp. OAS728]MBE1529762.1 hypothetical protein [Sphingopyxis sp. OAS728]
MPAHFGCKAILFGARLFGFQLTSCHDSPSGCRAKVALPDLRKICFGGFRFAPFGLLAIMITCYCHGAFLSFNQSIGGNTPEFAA